VRFERDEKKAAANLRKHKVSFPEAVTVFYDPLSATGDDPEHSIDERRFVTFGISDWGRLLVVSHVDRSYAIRIISARQATRAEKGIYEETD
jgi:uncharacterized DUF497 family protein